MTDNHEATTDAPATSTELVQTQGSRRLDLAAVTFDRQGRGAMFMPRNMQEIVDFASMMAKSDFAIPPKFRVNPGACLAVAIQAFRWEMDPYAVIQKAYVTKSKDGSERLAYEAQLIAAVVNTRAPIVGRLKLRYEGLGAARKIFVTGRFIDSDEDTTLESPPISQIGVKNSPLWISDPDQQLAYYGQRAWGRRHCPEVLLGVYAPDEIEEDPAEADIRGAPRPKLIEAEPTPTAPPEEPKGAKKKPDTSSKGKPETAAAGAKPTETAKTGNGSTAAPGQAEAETSARQTSAKDDRPPATASEAPAAKDETEQQTVADEDPQAAQAEADRERDIAFEGAEATLLRAKDGLADIPFEQLDDYSAKVRDGIKALELNPEDAAVIIGRWNTTLLEHRRTASRRATKGRR